MRAVLVVVVLALCAWEAPARAQPTPPLATCPGHDPEADARLQQELRQKHLERELLRMDMALQSSLGPALEERLRSLSIGRIRGLERAAYARALARTRDCLNRWDDGLPRAFLLLLARALLGELGLPAVACAETTPWPSRLRHDERQSELWGAATNPLSRSASCRIRVFGEDGEPLAELPLGTLRPGDSRLFRRLLPRLEAAPLPARALVRCTWAPEPTGATFALTDYAGPRLAHPWLGGGQDGSPPPPSPDLLPSW